MSTENLEKLMDEFEKKYPGPTLGEVWDKERRQREAEEGRMLADARADAKAVWQLAEYYMPADIRQMADIWNMKETLIEMWRGAFIEGWRAALRK